MAPGPTHPPCTPRCRRDGCHTEESAPTGPRHPESAACSRGRSWRAAPRGFGQARAGARRSYGIARRRVPAPGASAPLPLFPPSPQPLAPPGAPPSPWFRFSPMSSSRSPAARSLSGLAAASRRGCSPCVAFPAPDLKRPLHPTPPLAPPTRLHFLLLLFTARLSPDPIRGPGGVVCAPIAQNSPRPTAPAQ